MNAYEVAIVGAGPGGLACAIKAKEMGLNYVILEKGQNILQGIIDSYPSGKKVYPTIPRGQSDHFPMPDLEPGNEPVEEYVAKVKSSIAKHERAVRRVIETVSVCPCQMQVPDTRQSACRFHR